MSATIAVASESIVVIAAADEIEMISRRGMKGSWMGKWSEDCIAWMGYGLLLHILFYVNAM